MAVKVHEAVVRAALEVRERAYARYSKFLVGAALLANNGQIFAGCNIENASYGLTVCAERVAIFNAVAAGNKKIKKLATSCLKGDTSNPGSLMSCGACRQVISEFLEDDGVILVDGVGSFTMDEYLPLRFKLPG